MIELTVHGEVVAKGRPRVTRTHAYTPQKTVDYEELIKQEFMVQCRGVEPLTGPLKIEMDLYMYIPKNTSKIRREKKNKGDILPTKRPDYDNLAKSITDALNGLAYEDDNQIVTAIINKRFSDDQRAEVKITQINKKGV